MSRTDGSHSSSIVCRKAGGLFTITQAQLHRRDDLWGAAAPTPAFHRKALFPQSREKLFVDIVESAVAENHDHVFWAQHRNDSLHNRVGILLVERRPAGLGNRSHDPLRFEPLIFRDLFEPSDLRDENTVSQFKRFRELLLKHRPPRRIRAGLEHGPQSLSAKAMPERLQCLRDRSGMMSEIVDDLNAASFAAKLLPACNPRETVERASDFFGRHVIEARRRRRHCGVMNIEFADKRNFKNIVAEAEP